jgi:hypothetical protein
MHLRCPYRRQIFLNSSVSGAASQLLDSGERATLLHSTTHRASVPLWEGTRTEKRSRVPCPRTPSMGGGRRTAHATRALFAGGLRHAHSGDMGRGRLTDGGAKRGWDAWACVLVCAGMANLSTRETAMIPLLIHGGVVARMGSKSGQMKMAYIHEGTEVGEQAEREV